MYVWNESIASRGSQEIASCIFRHIKEKVPTDTQKIIAYSDSCFGQNKNIKMALMLKTSLNLCSHPKLKTIEQIFFLSGHSYNSCDRAFSSVEKEKKRTKEIFIPQHWYNIIRNAKTKDPKFNVIQMQRNDFFSIDNLTNLLINRKKTIDGMKISWLNIQNIIYEKSAPYTLFIKNYGSDSVESISLFKKGTSNVDDLQSLLQHIPSKYHGFYRKLKQQKLKK